MVGNRGTFPDFSDFSIIFSNFSSTLLHFLFWTPRFCPPWKVLAMPLRKCDLFDTHVTTTELSQPTILLFTENILFANAWDMNILNASQILFLKTRMEEILPIAYQIMSITHLINKLCITWKSVQDSTNWGSIEKSGKCQQELDQWIHTYIFILYVWTNWESQITWINK